MKPNFALTLSFEGIRLLQRAFPGWTSLGEVSLASGDLSADLEALRAKGPKDLRSKLVLPNDQIKYISQPIPEGDAEEAARAALTGATPYEVDELAYDFVTHDGQIHIAAVARETLAEAEAFAAEHGFSPMSFVAIPDDGDFTGEPFFGMTSHARGTLAPGETVERDSAPIRIIGTAPPQPEAGDEGADEGEADTTAEPESELEPSAETPAQEEITAAQEMMAQEKTAQEETAQEETAQAPESPAEPAQTSPQDAGTETAGTEDAAAEDTSAADTPAPADEDAPSGFASIRATRGDPPAGPVPRLSGASRLTSLDGTEIARTAPAVASPVAPDAPSAAPPLDAPRGPAPAHVTDDGLDIPDTATPTPEIASPAAAAASLRPGPDTQPGTEPDARPDPGMDTDTDTAHAADPLLDTATAPPPEFVKTGSFFSRRQPAGAPQSAPPAAAAPVTATKKDAKRARREREKQRMTVFGARGHEVGGKPRFLGLILTAVLMLFLVGVAAWASVFLDDGLARLFGGPKDIKVSEVPASEEDAEQAAITPLPQDAPELAALAPDTIEPLPDITPLPDLPEALSPSEALARYAATGIWQMAPQPPSGDNFDAVTTEVFEAGTDPALTLAPAPDITPPPTPEIALAAQINPPPAGVLFDFDERGLIRAVAGGVVSPGGVRILAGRPALLPPEGFFDRLPSQAAEAQPSVTEASLPTDTQITAAPEAEQPAETAETAPETAAEPAPGADPALAGLRPRARPEGLAPEAAAPDEESAAPASETGTGTETVQASLRPQARPASVFAAAQQAANDAAQQEAAQNEASAATLRSDDSSATPLIDTDALNRALTDAASQPAPEAARDPSLFESPTAQAVTASLIPLTRPRDFENTVERAREEAATTPVPAAQVVTPSIPTRASVARQATQQNAINLRKVNLIGVYGAPNSRRALVRLGNGRYKKVKVGDRLDGGEVAAIGDSELRYVKRGRNLTLQMPRG